jgi:hypothetical protein
MRALVVVGLALLGSLVAQRPQQAVAETEQIKLFRLRSERLSAFWGREQVIEAGVVLPPGHGDGKGRWAVCYDIHGFGGSHRAAWSRGQQLLTKMEQGDYPRLLYVYLNAHFPLGHHEFADSVNNGPWGQALTEEFIPALEQAFGAAAKPSARFLTGHSSGGWSSLWLQVTYPEFFGGTWSTAPDPVDFRDFTGFDIYSAKNAYVGADGQPIQLMRRGGAWLMTIQQFTERELQRRDYGGQMASFDAVFSPRGEDGRPMRLWNRETGDLDPVVAQYWRRYDISWLLRDQWAMLGPKLGGKLKVFCGLQDTFRLEGACKLLKVELAKLGSDAEVILVEERDHGTLLRPHELWPQGLLDRIHREMHARHVASQR